jgi:hypothetical protein
VDGGGRPPPPPPPLLLLPPLLRGLLGAAEIMVLDYLSLVCEHNY